MLEKEQRERMRLMRQQVREQNMYTAGLGECW
jgi:hypothetical protein